MAAIKSYAKFAWSLGRDLILLGCLILCLAVLTELLTDAHWPAALGTGQFWLAVGFNMLPAAAVTLAVFGLAARFLGSVYRLPGWGASLSFLVRSRLGQLGFSPYMVIKEGRNTAPAEHILNRLGGPGSLVIYHDSAAVLEQGGRLTRTLGPGFHKLERWEKVYDVVDLRPKRWVYTVEAMTRDGISIKWEAEVLYQVAGGEEQPTEKSPYPFSEKDVFQAATCKWRREQSRTQDMDWEGRVVIGDAEGILRSIVARRSLDQLIGLTEVEEQAAREAIQAELAQALDRSIYPRLGARLLQVKLANLRVEDEVTQELIRVWKAGWQSWSDAQWGEGQANRICEYEQAKAEAQAWLIESLAQGQPVESPVVLMRLFSTLDRAHLPASARVFVPGQALDTLEEMRRLLNGQADANADSSAAQDQSGGRPPGSSPKPDGAPSRPAAPFNEPPAADVSFRIPVIDQIAAGKEIPAFDDIIGQIEQTGAGFRLAGQTLGLALLKGSRLTFSQEYHYFAVQVRGDSMDRAGVWPGDYVLLQKSNRVQVRPASGDIVAVVFQDEVDEPKATLKRIQIKKDGVNLIPESSNPGHQARRLSPKAFSGSHPAVRIAGVAIAVFKPVTSA